MSWCVYLLECSNKTLYTGITMNLDRRVAEHNSGHGGKYTKIFGPVKLLWKEEQPTKLMAKNREQQIKKWTRRKKLALAIGNKNLLKTL